jgi:poly-gamma-glutamate synthesis protein (capsule biosynthesis protein)
MLDRNVAKNMSTSGLDYIFANVSTTKTRMFGAADMLIANLEGPFAPTRIKTSKSIAFRFDSKLAEQLKAYGFHGFSLANNHSYDMGRANVPFTRQVLEKNGLGYFGDELNEGAVYTWFKNDIAFIGIHNTYHEPDLKKLAAAMVDVRKKARYVIVNVHWGEEYKRISNKKQRDLAHWLIDNGATAVIGHHPHVVQEMEIYQGAPIFYSLGNFIFDQYFSKDTQEGLSVGLILQDGKVKSAYLFPFYGVKSQVQLMTEERRDEFLKWVEENSRLDGGKIVDGKFVY